MVPTPDPGPPRGLDAAALARLLGDQSGVVSRAQVVACGGAPHDLGRLVRRRELVRVLPGVFVDHTGRPTWLQRAWAGCLYYEPAALAGPSALRAVSGPGWRHHDDSGPVDLALDVSRRCVDAPGYRVRRVTGLAAKVQWNMSPPRIRVEEAALDEALRQPSRFAMIGVLADICQSRRTTAHRVLEAAGERGRLTDRSLLCGVLADIADGTCSTLEHAYLDLVERAHGLPVGRRQQPGSSERSGVLRDVDYDPLLFLVELDGRLFHDTSGQRDRDLDRDLDAAVDGRRTVRLGWGQVIDRPCRTAARVAALLARAGWTGTPTRCGPDCRL
ncbi:MULTISPECIES: hypothetical protein [unclassified Nocardioides]|uniref:hypothetical protein n=1 Tax=unclassified Nocardioides TaxID=2615069 RepID=UPI0018D2C8A2|nr:MULTISPECIES: hypothetical protein [unclassified Nocardioides]